MISIVHHHHPTTHTFSSYSQPRFPRTFLKGNNGLCCFHSLGISKSPSASLGSQPKSAASLGKLKAAAVLFSGLRSQCEAAGVCCDVTQTFISFFSPDIHLVGTERCCPASTREAMRHGIYSHHHAHTCTNSQLAYVQVPFMHPPVLSHRTQHQNTRADCIENTGRSYDHKVKVIA